MAITKLRQMVQGGEQGGESKEELVTPATRDGQKKGGGWRELQQKQAERKTDRLSDASEVRW